MAVVVLVVKKKGGGVGEGLYSFFLFF